MDRFRLDGRTALVTEASRGIGAAIAVALDAAGARVAITTRDRGRLDDVAGSLADDPVVLEADLANPSSPTCWESHLQRLFAGSGPLAVTGTPTPPS